MTKEMFDKLKQHDFDQAETLSVHDLDPYLRNDRTLLYGYTCERKTFHVYLKDEKIYVVVYCNDYSTPKTKPRNMVQIRVTSNHDYVPDKRLYPERCDYEFCRLLKEKGIELPFTAYSDEVNLDREYYGFTLEDVEGVVK